jgi:hypothetical protein
VNSVLLKKQVLQVNKLPFPHMKPPPEELNTLEQANHGLGLSESKTELVVPKTTLFYPGFKKLN